MTEPFLQIARLTKRYGDVVAVNEISLDVARGEFLTFLGPSGSGKSTTLYAVAGFDGVTSGDIRIEGRSILGTPPNKRNIGMVFQRYTLFPHLTVSENIAFPLRVRRQPSATIAAKVRAMLALVHLDGFGDRMPAQLSGGQQQRVALARALAYDPPVLLMDEPLSALDKKLRDEIQIEIRRIHQETGVTILYVTHDQEEALRLSDRIAVFNQGQIEQIGTGEDLYLRPATRFVAEFIGDSNFLEITGIEHTEGNRASARLPDGTVLDGLALHKKPTASGRFDLMVRPQWITLAAGQETGDGARLTVSVRDVTYLGENASALLVTGWGQDIWIKTQAERLRGLRAGDSITIGWDKTRSELFER